MGKGTWLVGWSGGLGMNHGSQSGPNVCETNRRGGYELTLTFAEFRILFESFHVDYSLGCFVSCV